MSETPTEETTAKGRGAYLAALPPGWVYEVTLHSPDRNTKIVVDSDPGRDRHAIAVISEGKPRNTLAAESLSDATKTAVRAARSLAKINEKEQELATERAALLEALGGTENLVDVAALQRSLGKAPAES